MRGLFITDISEQFPVFHIARQMGFNDFDIYMYIFKKLYSFENKENICQAMDNINWDEFSRATDTHQTEKITAAYATG